MPLRLVRRLSIVTVISLAIILIFATDWLVRSVVGALILAGAIPWWKTITRATAGAALQSARNHLTLLEDVHHTPEDDQVSED